MMMSELFDASMPTVVPANTRVARRYDELALWMERVPWYRDAAIPRIVASSVPAQSRRCLELCCGGGWLAAELLRAHNWEKYIAVDISTRMVELARDALSEFGNARVLVGDWICPVAGDEPFDVVIVKNALHLLDNLTNRLRELNPLVAADGVLVIVETISPSGVANKFVRELFACTDDKDLKYHYFTKDSLQRILTRCGWHAVDQGVDVPQYVDVATWLSQKCGTASARRAAMNVITNCSDIVRGEMQFTPGESQSPSRMLRLQRVGRYRMLRDKQLQLQW